MGIVRRTTNALNAQLQRELMSDTAMDGEARVTFRPRAVAPQVLTSIISAHNFASTAMEDIVQNKYRSLSVEDSGRPRDVGKGSNWIIPGYRV
jgi:hypothetical protein